MRLILFIAIILKTGEIFGQVLPVDRRTDWSLAGVKTEMPDVTVTVDMAEEGGVADGVTSNNVAFSAILDAYEGEVLEIYFSPGVYFFDSGISLPTNCTLVGLNADSTTLRFDLGGASENAINVNGSLDATTSALISPIDFGTNTCLVVDPDFFEVDDWVMLVDDDTELITSDWAAGKTGQILQIREKIGDTIVLDSPFRRNYLLENEPYVVKVNLKEHVNIKNLKIERLDATDAQTNNISFRYAANCRVNCIESDRCNFAHISFEYSSNCDISGNYFHDGHDYGGGGKAYGVVCQFATGECLVTDNNFEHLRHSMLLQAGANGNVYSYNYSQDPFWTGVALPSNSAGDAVLHGNYVYCNLFEGNILQNIVIDNSHGINGPYNTFFRNRAELYGIFMNNSPASNSQNFIGNEIPNEDVFLGLYVFEGTDHFFYGNNHRGETKPEGTGDLTEASLYLDEIPFYYENYSAWPPIGYPHELSDFNNESYNNYALGYEIKCENEYTDLGLDNFPNAFKFEVFPNPTADAFTVISADDTPLGLVQVLNLQGQVCVKHETSTNTLTVNMVNLASGFYVVRVRETSVLLQKQ